MAWYRYMPRYQPAPPPLTYDDICLQILDQRVISTGSYHPGSIKEQHYVGE